MGCRSQLLSLIILLALLMQAVSADEPYRYPEAKWGKGELKYIAGIPVAVIQGSPAEMGEQLGVLTLKPAGSVVKMLDKYVERQGWQQAYSMALNGGHVLIPLFPPEHAQEMKAAAEASGWPAGLLIFGNTVTDLRRLINCSVFIVESDRSKRGGPLFGRNLDWPPFGALHELTFVAIYRPTGKHSFASVTFPGLLGCASGMNDAGLAAALLDSTCEREGVSNFNLLGTPTTLALRRALEECTTVDEAIQLFRSIQRASSFNVALCDKQRSVVLEITPQTVAVRSSESGLSICTNHFRSPELATSTECWRYETLKRSTNAEKYDLADVAKRMHSVNQGEMTLQAMIFEPASLRLHLAFGPGPATRLPHSTLELAELFR